MFVHLPCLEVPRPVILEKTIEVPKAALQWGNGETPGETPWGDSLGLLGSQKMCEKRGTLEKQKSMVAVQGATAPQGWFVLLEMIMIPQPTSINRDIEIQLCKQYAYYVLCGQAIKQSGF